MLILDVHAVHTREKCYRWMHLYTYGLVIKKSQLHIAVDDATGTIVGAYFDYQETLNGYYNILHQILIKYGIPYMFFTDRRTVFEYKQKKSPSIEEDTFTQFGYACNQLGIEIKTSSVAQAKGRFERNIVSRLSNQDFLSK